MRIPSSVSGISMPIWISSHSLSTVIATSRRFAQYSMLITIFITILVDLLAYSYLHSDYFPPLAVIPITIQPPSLPNPISPSPFPSLLKSPPLFHPLPFLTSSSTPQSPCNQAVPHSVSPLYTSPNTLSSTILPSPLLITSQLSFATPAPSTPCLSSACSLSSARSHQTSMLISFRASESHGGNMWLWGWFSNCLLGSLSRLEST